LGADVIGDVASGNRTAGPSTTCISAGGVDTEPSRTRFRRFRRAIPQSLVDSMVL